MLSQYLDFAMGAYPKESRIAAAKRNAVGGKRKRCTKGKNCSAACIAANMVCLVDLPWVGPSLTKVVQLIKSRKAGQGMPAQAAAPAPTTKAAAPAAIPTPKAQLQPAAPAPTVKAAAPAPAAKPAAAPAPTPKAQPKPAAAPAKAPAPKAPAPKAQPKPAAAPAKAPAKAPAPAAKPAAAKAAPEPKTQPAPKPQVPDAQKPLPNAPPHVSKAYGFDKNFNSQSARKEGDASFDGWGSSYGNTTKKIGQGSFGTVVLNPDGTVIKRGIISDTEAAILKKAGEAGVSPKLIAAEIGPRNNTPTSAPVQLHDGRIAMSKASGRKTEDVAGQTFNGTTTADAFWRARGDLHKIGIAHNDMHTENILVNLRGKGTVIDLGFAQDSRKAALSEALGAFKPPSAGTAIPGVGKQKGDWQVRQWNGNAGFRLQDVEKQGLNSKAAEKLLKEAPYLHRLYTQNLPKVFAEMKKMGYNDDEIKTIAITGIKNKLDAYEKGPWAKMTDADAQKLTNILYDDN